MGLGLAATVAGGGLALGSDGVVEGGGAEQATMNAVAIAIGRRMARCYVRRIGTHRKPPDREARGHTIGVEADAACSSCGLVVEGGTQGCQRLFESIGLREYEDMRFARYHRIVVDVYAMQHPDRYGRSAKSFAAHLTGLCAWIDDEANAQSVNAAVQRWLSGPSPIEKPALPTSFGADTVRALVDTDDPVRYGQVLRRWARTTWDAYASLHSTAHAWIAAAQR